MSALSLVSIEGEEIALAYIEAESPFVRFVAYRQGVAVAIFRVFGTPPEGGNAMVSSVASKFDRYVMLQRGDTLSVRREELR